MAPATPSVDAGDRRLPPGFEDLEPFADWALPTETERTAKKVASAYEEIVSFYEAVIPRAEAMGTYLDQFPLEDLKGADARLMDLLLALAAIMSAIEFYQAPFNAEAVHPSRLVPQEHAPRRPRF